MRRLEVLTWFERDRAHIELRDTKTDKTIIEFWDEEVHMAIEDGYLIPGFLRQSVIEYAKQRGLLPGDIKDGDQTE